MCSCISGGEIEAMPETVVSVDQYADLEIRILERTDKGYPVELTLDGEQEFPRGYLTPDVLPWVPSASPELDGERLFGLLFAEDRLRTAWAEIRGQTPLRRVRLRVDEAAPELHAIPWELLREVGPDEQPQTIAATAATPFSRDLAGKWRPIAPISTRPIRMLVAIANPGGLADYRLAPIDVAAERRAIEESLARIGQSSLTVTFLPEPVTLAGIEAALKEGGYHILHIVAHGLYHPGRARALLFLADPANQVARVAEIEFAAMLARQRQQLRLVFLASCQSASRSPADAFRGFAPQLIATGVPSVVAMQDLVPVETARVFAATFYRSLLQHGRVDVAGNAARSALLSESPAATWGVPVVFSRVPNCVLFTSKYGYGPLAGLRQLWDDIQPIKRAIGLLIAVLGVIATLLALYRDPAVYRLIFGRGRMSGDLNIAVAQFGGLDEQGRVIRLDAAEGLSLSMYTFLGDQLQSLKQDRFNIEIWPPSQTGPIKGATPAERAAAAADLAKQIGADIVVYGTLDSRADASSLIPEFYIAEDKLAGAEELSGAHSLGSSISSPGATTNPATRRELNDRLLARTGALAQFVVGLAYFANGDYDNASKYFQAAENTQGWDPRDGKEVLYLFLGTAALHRNDLTAAEGFYNQAIQINPAYARARLGLGEIQYHRSRGTTCEPGQTDVAGVEKAVAIYNSALQFPAPAEAKISAKTAWFTGRAYLCLTRAQVDRRADAERALQQLIGEYQRGNQGVSDLAAEAHANLGLLNLTVLPGDTPAVVTTRYQVAAKEYSQAIEISRHPEWQAYYAVSLTFIHLSLGECDAAAEAWARAADLHRRAVRPNPSYEPWHDYVEKQWAGSACQRPAPTP
jgi:tetratricopeptide (TPR) repeat protein